MNQLTEQQRATILKYWENIDLLTCQVNNFYDEHEYKEVKDSGRGHFSTPKSVYKINRRNENLNKKIEKLKGKLEQYEREYQSYINNLGLELNNREYDEPLFQLLNNGIIIY